MPMLEFHPEAEAEYQAAINWYRSRSLQAAARFVAEVERVSEKIGEQPELYAKDEDGNHSVLLRRFPYSVIYRVFAERILVIAVAHAQRKEAYWQQRLEDLK